MSLFFKLGHFTELRNLPSITWAHISEVFEVYFHLMRLTYEYITNSKTMIQYNNKLFVIIFIIIMELIFLHNEYFGTFLMQSIFTQGFYLKLATCALCYCCLSK